MKISQSIIKGFIDYRNGEGCGLQYEAQYFKGVGMPSTDAQKLGQYFEYLALGNPARGGGIPEPETTQKGELTAKYKIAKEQAAVFKATLDAHNIHLLETNLTIETETETETGTIDFIGQSPALGKFIGDVKFTANLNNKWDDYSWNKDALATKDKIMIQAVHYTQLFENVRGEKLPFLFFVFSSTNTNDSAIYSVNIDPNRYEEHRRTMNFVRAGIELELELGFTARPERGRCLTCPLFDSCKFKTTVPLITKIDY